MRPLGLLLFACACTQDFGPFEPTDGAVADAPAEIGADGAPSDAGPTDAPADAVACTESGAILFGGHCYFLNIGTQSFFTAMNGCAAVGAHLVTITSTAEQSAVSPLGAGTERWIGLRRQNGSPPQDSSYTWITGEPRAGFATWAAGEPNGSGSCGAMLPASNWADESCSQAFSSICERE